MEMIYTGQNYSVSSIPSAILSTPHILANATFQSPHPSTFTEARVSKKGGAPASAILEPNLPLQAKVCSHYQSKIN